MGMGINWLNEWWRVKHKKLCPILSQAKEYKLIFDIKTSIFYLDPRSSLIRFWECLSEKRRKWKYFQEIGANIIKNFMQRSYFTHQERVKRDCFLLE